MTSDTETIDTALLERAAVKVVIVTPSDQRWWTCLSSWRRTLGVVQRMLSWKYRLLQRIELEAKSEQVLFRIIQPECFSQELADLHSGKAVQHT